MQKQSVNFAIYSCDWTKMNLKFKKLLLFSMQTNHVNKILLKASPRKTVDLQLFLNVLRILYLNLFKNNVFVTDSYFISGNNHVLQRRIRFA